APSGSRREPARPAAPGAGPVYGHTARGGRPPPRALRKPAPAGAVSFVDADVHDPATIMADARETLDFGQPVAVMLLFTLAHVEGKARAAAIVSAMMAAVASGSHLAMYHLASDLDPALPAVVRRWDTRSCPPVT